MEMVFYYLYFNFKNFNLFFKVPNGVSLASGRIISPNYPHSPYLANSSCTTKFFFIKNI